MRECRWTLRSTVREHRSATIEKVAEWHLWRAVQFAPTADALVGVDDGDAWQPRDVVRLGVDREVTLGPTQGVSAGS